MTVIKLTGFVKSQLPIFKLLYMSELFALLVIISCGLDQSDHWIDTYWLKWSMKWVVTLWVTIKSKVRSFFVNFDKTIFDQTRLRFLKISLNSEIVMPKGSLSFFLSSFFVSQENQSTTAGVFCSNKREHLKWL